jgi:cytochrome c oxidase assembly protein subunit 15
MVALAMLCIIVVSGAAVRLTGSGLGCDDWPNCNASRLIDVSSKHAAIEQINRLFTGLVSAAVIVAVLGALVRVPRRRDLVWHSVGLVVGVLAQIVLGGITVLVDLHPAAVQGHLLVSMALVANAIVLLRRAGEPDPVPGTPRRRAVSDRTAHLAWALAIATGAAIVAGTIVTGAGPHAGDEDARRFDIAIPTAVRIHSVAVWIAVAIALVLVRQLSKRPADRERLDGPLTAWVAVAVMQGVVGYVQYFSDVPALLVGIHVAGLTAVWSITCWILAVGTERSPVAVADASAGSPGGDGSELRGSGPDLVHG